MITFATNKLIQQRADSGKLYLEFLRVPSMSMGLYTLEAGATDPQQPHNEDEVYYIVSGRGQIYVAGENQPVQAGSIVFVAAHDAHYFHSIEETLNILVFFAPAET
ncbi:MAG: cupin domain-containing protein [Anaerolineales bacterium]|nr:cupin domain-containing protein [Anaerolineales bacterium]